MARPALALLAVLAACAVPSRPHRLPEAPAPVVRATLPNGLEVVIVPNSLAPVATTVVTYRVGSVEAPPAFPGMAHADEHMMFRGSPGLSADQLASVMATLGGRFNADTQQTVTQYFFTVPADEVEVPLHVEALRMRDILATTPLWEKERGAIEQEVAQDVSTPEYLAWEGILGDAFRGTPYEHDALGTRPSFERTTAAMLRAFHGTWYAPNNAVVIVAGAVDPPRTLATIERLFGDIPSKPLPARLPVDLQPMVARRIDLPTDRPSGLVFVAFRLPGTGSPDYAAARVLASVLASRRGPLYALTAASKVIETDFSIEGLPAASLGLAEAAFPRGADTTAVLAEVREALARTVTDGVAADLVEAAKRREVLDAELEKDSVEGLAMAWSRALTIEGRQSPEDVVRAVEAVTVADVDRVARAHLDLGHSVDVVLTPRVSGQPTPGAAARGSESFAPEHVEQTPLPDWAAKAIGAPAPPALTVRPVDETLPNGLRLLIQPERVSRAVRVYGHVRNQPGLETPAGQEGVNEILARLFRYGTTTRDRLAFERALDDIGAEEQGTTSFGVKVLGDQLDAAVALLADHVMHPGLRAHDFQTVQRELAAELPGRLQSPAYLAHRALEQALLPPGDPMLRQPSPATVSALDVEDVRAYHRRTFRPDLTTIVVIGNVTPAAARAAVARSFGAWTATGEPPQTDLPPVPANAPVRRFVPDSSRLQDEVWLAETLAVPRSSPDYYALDVGNHVLSGAFYATRLYRDLRERRGLVYHVDSSIHVGKTRGALALEYACDPQHVARARAIVERDLGQMQSTLVHPEELLQARRLALGGIALEESSEGEIAKGLLGRVEDGLSIDEPVRAAEMYLRLSAGDVQDAFRRWVETGRLVQVVWGPRP
jgi:zinc protease